MPSCHQIDRRITLTLSMVALLLCLAPRAQSDNHALHHRTAADEQIQKIERIIARALAQPAAVGLSVAIARGDDLLLARGYGSADIENDVPMTERSRLRIGSITKQFTAALVLKLVEQGSLSLDDDLTDFVAYPTGDHVVTIRHLLNHTSGIPSYTGIDEFWKTGAMRELTHDELLAFVRDKPFDFPPGEQFRYNNTGYYLLGMVIEVVTEKPFAQAVDELLLTPLGLAETRYDENSPIVRHRARGYSFESGALINATALGMNNPGAAGAFMGTAHDLIRWQQMLVAGKYISAESYQLMTTPTTLADGTTEAYGFGLVMGDRFGHAVIDHGGGINGFTSILSYFPEHDIHIAVLSNSEGLFPGPISDQIAAVLLGVEQPETLDLPLTDRELSRLSGQYHIADLDLRVTLLAQGGTLYARVNAQTDLRLQYQGDGIFVSELDSTLRFFADELRDDDVDRPVSEIRVQHVNMTIIGKRIDE